DPPAPPRAGRVEEDLGGGSAHGRISSRSFLAVRRRAVLMGASPPARSSVSLGGGWSGTGWQAGVDRSVPSRDSSFLWLHQDALAATCPRWCGRSAPAWPTAMA